MRAAFFAAALILPVVVCAPSAGAQTSISVWDGVYTAAQATEGADAFGQHCASCHGAGLEGTGEAPGLTGSQFLSDFNGLTMGALFDRTRTSMPQDAPDSLSRETYAAILAFILKANGFPAGQKPLDHRSAYLSAIAFQSTNPHPGASPAAAQAPAGAPPGASPSPAAPAARPTAPRAFQGAPPADPDALAAADRASGVLSPTASDPRNAPDSQPDPYRAVSDFLKLPAGRVMGSTSAVGVDSQGHVWVVDRCGANNCAGSALDPIMEFDAQGNFIKAFGGGLLNFPHGFFVDSHDHLWITDVRAAGGKGADVLEFDESGKLLRTLGKPGVQGDGPDTFGEPTAVLVAPDGDIFVSDGHEAGPGHNARIVKFDPNGKFLMQWGGEHGVAAGHFDAPHCLAMDTEGRLYVGDRWNNRIQVFDQQGKLLEIYTQFGRPSGIYIDRHDIMYVTDSESRAPYGYGYHPGWKRGIRVGSVKDGIVTAFIPDPTPDQDKYATSGGEGIWVDTDGAIYSAQVKQRTVVKYVRH
jgi:sugar lactone lactonase YvrE/cytochrome c553